MTSLSKGQTEDTPQLSSDESTGALVQPSEPSAKTDNTKTSMTTTHLPLNTILPAGKPSEKVLSAADFAKAALTTLERAGLIRRFKVLSKDRKKVRAVVILFDNTYWTPELDLKVLSEGSDS